MKLTLKMDEETTIDVEYNDSDIKEYNRCDFLPLGVGKITKTDEGFLQGTAPVAKIGIMTYVMSDGSTHRELLPPETLFNDSEMCSLEMKPVTNSHPPEILLDRCSVKRRKVGMTGEKVKRDGDFLVTSMVITDDDAIKDINDGKQELSPGYRARVVVKSGTFRGEKFDAIQMSRKYNHLALCDRARGGRELKLNLDSIDVNRIDGFEITDLNKSTNNHKPNKTEDRMVKINIDGIEYEASPEVRNTLDKQNAKVDSQKSELETAKTDSEKLKADNDSLKAKVEELEKKDNSDEITKAVQSRISLELTANNCLDDEEKKEISKKTDEEIKKSVILKAFPKADEQLKDASEAYLDARFDSALEILDDKKDEKKDKDKKKTDSYKNVRGDGKGKDNKKNDEDRDLNDVKNDMVNDICNAWKHEDK